MEKCVSCGSEVAESSRFCSACGAELSSEALVTRTVAASEPPVPRSFSPKPVSGSSPRPPASPSSSMVSSVAASRFPPGTLFARRYRIVSLLGKGGMGEVYRAEDLTLEQPVALKFLPESIGANEGALTRFRSEVRIARQVSHPNVCRVYDVGEIDGQVFLSMEYVDGEDLASLLRRIGRLPADKALEISRKLCAGLAAAHEKGVLHRDLKPSNIMLDGRGNVLLTDFGLAGLADRIEGAEVRNGTPAYMAPEQLTGQEVTVKSDIYSLGLVLYEIFTGRRPFEAGSLAELVRLRSETAPASPSSLVRDLDPAVERAILRCLEPDPSRRPASALAVAAALPGGDPLAAALAAGETPSPLMVAAAGEGAGLAPRIAIGLLAFSLIALAVPYWVRNQRSVLDQVRPPYTPEILSQKARDTIQTLGYTQPVADDTYGLDWDSDYLRYVQTHALSELQSNAFLAQRRAPMQFWYRSSPYAIASSEFHDDLLTPGVVTFGDPPSILSGMIRLRLDAAGRLQYFEAVPPQLLESAKSTPAVDWNPLFSAAGLDPAQFQSTEPLWTWLDASDTRAAWTGKWPDSDQPLRVEAAAIRGKPVAFSLIGAWTKPGRMPPLESTRTERIQLYILIGITVLVMAGITLLARRNQKRKNLGDVEGATRLGFSIGCVLVALWICRAHLSPSIETFGIFLLEMATAIFYGFLLRTMYLALEPYVRRRWPQTIISWTAVLRGRAQDPVVGRDILIGIAVQTGMQAITSLVSPWFIGTSSKPYTGSTEALL
jgi:predicted Ser/Thr protein kinase